MGKYIDADRFRAEIEKTYKSEIQPWLSGVSATSAIYDYVLPLIDSLQQEQPDVDLEEITKFSRIKDLPDGFDKDWLMYYHTDKEYNSVKFHHFSTLEREYIIARHFFDLGLNARKED